MVHRGRWRNDNFIVFGIMIINKFQNKVDARKYKNWTRHKVYIILPICIPKKNNCIKKNLMRNFAHCTVNIIEKMHFKLRVQIPLNSWTVLLNITNT